MSEANAPHSPHASPSPTFISLHNRKAGKEGKKEKGKRGREEGKGRREEGEEKRNEKNQLLKRSSEVRCQPIALGIKGVRRIGFDPK